MVDLRSLNPVAVTEGIVSALGIDKMLGMDARSVATATSGVVTGYGLSDFLYEMLLKGELTKAIANVLTSLGCGVALMLGRELPSDVKMYLLIVGLISGIKSIEKFGNFIKAREVEEEKVKTFMEKISKGEFAEALKEIVKSPEEVWEELSKFGKLGELGGAAGAEVVPLTSPPAGTPSATPTYVEVSGSELSAETTVPVSGGVEQRSEGEEKTQTVEELNHG